MSRESVMTMRIVNEIDALQRIGASRSAVVAGRLRAAAIRMYNGGPQPDFRRIILDELRDTLRDGMLAGHLYGLRRGIILRPKESEVQRPENPWKVELSLSVYSTIIKLIKKRMNVDVDRIQQQYDTQALRVLNNVSDKVESRLRQTIDALHQEGASTREAIQTLGDEFAKLGISPKSKSQLETIFRTQTQITYSAGRWEADQDPDIQEILWGYKYVTVGDDRVRPTHEVLDNTTLPKDDPFWARFFPPNGWNCRCQAISIFEERAPVRAPSALEDGTVVQPDQGFNFNPGSVFSTAL